MYVILVNNAHVFNGFRGIKCQPVYSPLSETFQAFLFSDVNEARGVIVEINASENHPPSFIEVKHIDDVTGMWL